MNFLSIAEIITPTLIERWVAPEIKDSLLTMAVLIVLIALKVNWGRFMDWLQGR